MSAINETIINSIYRIFDKDSGVWKKFSWWGKAKDTEFDDGQNAEDKLGAINGITDSLVSDASDIAASAKSVKMLSQCVGGGNVIFKIEDGILYWQERGADTWLPFRRRAWEHFAMLGGVDPFAYETFIDFANDTSTVTSVLQSNKAVDYLMTSLPLFTSLLNYTPVQMVDNAYCLSGIKQHSDFVSALVANSDAMKSIASNSTVLQHTTIASQSGANATGSYNNGFVSKTVDVDNTITVEGIIVKLYVKASGQFWGSDRNSDYNGSTVARGYIGGAKVIEKSGGYTCTSESNYGSWNNSGTYINNKYAEISNKVRGYVHTYSNTSGKCLGTNQVTVYYL